MGWTIMKKINLTSLTCTCTKILEVNNDNVKGYRKNCSFKLLYFYCWFFV